MKPFLLDTNVLIALLWPAHKHHSVAQQWFGSIQRAGWATCPFTQCGFVRIITDPAFSRDAVTPSEACQRLAAVTGHPRHRFFPATISYPDATSLFLMHKHQQITDAYLLGLAIHHKAKLATFDTGIAKLLPDGDRQHASLHLIEGA